MVYHVSPREFRDVVEARRHQGWANLQLAADTLLICCHHAHQVSQLPTHSLALCSSIYQRSVSPQHLPFLQFLHPIVLPLLQMLLFNLEHNHLSSALEVALARLLLCGAMSASHQHYSGLQVVKANLLPLLAGRPKGLRRE